MPTMRCPRFSSIPIRLTTAGLTYPGLSQIGTTGQITAKMTTIWRSHTLKYGIDERDYWYAAPVPGGYPAG